MIKNAYKLCLGIFPQSATGSNFAALPEEEALTKWALQSIIPNDYEFTNFQVGDTTIETVEKNTITALTKAKKFDSGAITPPTFTFANMTPADAGSVVSTLDKLQDVADPFKILFCAGSFQSETNGTRSYQVFTAAAGILTTDGGRTGEAKQLFTGSLALQSCHIPIVGASTCNATLTWNTSTGAISLVIGGGK